MTKKEKLQKRKQLFEELNKLNNIRDEANRRFETLNIIFQLKQNNLNSSYPAIKKLLQIINDYVIKGEKQETIIDFPEQNKYIKVYLPIYKDEECTVVLRSK